MRIKLLTLLTVVFCVQIVSAQKLDLLQKSLETVNLPDLCKAHYKPYPPYSDRTYWGSLDEVVKAQAISDGERALDFEWKTVSLTSYLDFTRKGIRQPNDLHIGARHKALSNLVLAELVEGKGRFIDAIVNGIWSLCEQSTWVATAHIANQYSGKIPDVNKRAIDLSSGETANAISWAYYFFNETFTQISPLLTQRIEDELNKHILNVFLDRNDLWWMATKEGAFVNNWNVWCNFNVLLTAIIMEKDAARKEQIIRKTMRSVDQFINYYGNDGGCEEGPTYWDHAGGKLMEYLALLKRFSGDKINIFDNERIKNIGTYIAKAHIDSLYFVNFADAEAIAKPIPTTIYRYGKEINDSHLMGFGSYIANIAGFKDRPLSGSMDMMLWQTELYKEIVATKPNAALYKSVWLDKVEVAMARQNGGSDVGFTFAAKGGFNDESHNHNDAGSFITYLNGKPMIVDVGVGTYTAQTFSGDRYSIWTMRSEFHNLPQVNSFGQSYGKAFKADDVKYNDNGKIMQFSAQLSSAYPVEAQCKSWVRSYTFDRAKKQITIIDKYELNEVVGQTSSNFIVACDVDATIKGEVLLNNGSKAVLHYDARALTCVTEVVEITDPRLTKVWGNSVTRLKFIVAYPTKKGEMKMTLCL